jgi:hypothetical protein
MVDGEATILDRGDAGRRELSQCGIVPNSYL